jgi:8-oxo-dGTP pyrophosphatase MutT (NUDIX family)
MTSVPVHLIKGRSTGGCVLYRHNGGTNTEYLIVKLKSGKWNIPGGNCNKGESILSGCLRETFEETRGVIGAPIPRSGAVLPINHPTSISSIPFCYAIEGFVIVPLRIINEPRIGLDGMMRSRAPLSGAKKHNETVDFRWVAYSTMHKMHQNGEFAEGFGNTMGGLHRKTELGKLIAAHPKHPVSTYDLAKNFVEWV